MTGQNDPTPEDKTIFEDMIAGFKDSLLAGGVGQQTAKTYRANVLDFAKDAGPRPWDWTVGAFEQWVSKGIEERKWKPTTAYNKQIAMRQFCSLLLDQRYKWHDLCQRLSGRAPQQLVQRTIRFDPESRSRSPLTFEQTQKFLDELDRQSAESRDNADCGYISHLTYAAALKVALAFGLRVSELINLKVGDFQGNPVRPQFDRYGFCFVRRGKGGKARRVLLVAPMAWVVPVLRDYVDNVRPLRTVDSEYLFVGGGRNKISHDGLGRCFRRAADAIGLNRTFVCHSLRHTYASTLAQWNFPAYFISKQLGHEFLWTTQLYIKLDQEYLDFLDEQSTEDFGGQAA
jgi:integrase